MFRDLISGYDGIVILAFFLLPRLHIDRNKLNWHIRLGQPNWLSRLLGYEVGERTCEDFPLEYIEGGLFPFEDLGSIAIPLKQSKTGEKSLSLSDLDSWPGSRSLEIDDERRYIIISRIKDYCAANGIQVKESEDGSADHQQSC